MRVDVSKIGVTISTNIAILCAAHGKSAADIAKVAGIRSHNTLNARKSKPGNWTLGQLVHIAAYFGKPVEWLLVAHEEAV